MLTCNCCSGKMDKLIEFSKRLEGNDLEELIEKVKRESNKLLE